LKNQSGEYYLFYNERGTDDYLKVLKSTNGMDWVEQTGTTISSLREFNFNSFTYNNSVYNINAYAISYYYMSYSNDGGNTWTTTSTGIKKYDSYYLGFGADCCYYDGTWNLVISKTTGSGSVDLKHYQGTPPSSWTEIAELREGGGRQGISNNYLMSFHNPELVVFDGKLWCIAVFNAGGNQDSFGDEKIGIKSFDGANWDADPVYFGSALDARKVFIASAKDPVNNNIVVVKGYGEYLNYTIWNGSSWSDEHVIYHEDGVEMGYYYTGTNPLAHGECIMDLKYIDHRLVCVFATNKRGNYNLNMISAPDYMTLPQGGVLQQYNRIQFPDATPSQTHVNSSVFYFKNIDSRTITEINITFADMGSIQCESNFKLWGSTDNSSWTDLGTTDVSGVLGPINSGTWATGMNWERGDIRYFKLEILDVGAVPEDLHLCDESIIWEITLE